MNKLLSVLALTGVLVSCTTNKNEVKLNREELKNKINSLINSKIEELGYTGLSAAVVYDNDVILSQGYGYKDLENSIPANSDTLFQIGSVSKIFTATAIMQLHEDGLLNIDDPVYKYLPEFSLRDNGIDYKKITVRHLLNHQSGLPSLKFKEFFLSEPNNEKFLEVPYDLKNEYMAWEPGTFTAYNNLGICLLGSIITRVSGKTYDTYIKEDIFYKSGMFNSLTNLEKNLDMAKGYAAGKTMPTLAITDVPAGAFISTSNDMANFMLTTLKDYKDNKGLLLSRSTMESMYTQQNKGFKYDGDTKMGLTYFLHNINDELVVGHDGDLPPFHATMKMMPELGLGVYLVSNDELSAQMGVVNLGNQILEMVYEEITQTKIYDNLIEPLVLNRSESESNYITGDYAAGDFGLITISEKEKTISTMGLSAKIVSLEDDYFTLEGFEFLSFRQIDETTIDVYYQGLNLGVAFKCPKVELNDYGKKFIGTYIPKNEEDKLICNSLRIYYQEDRKQLIAEIHSNMGFMEFPMSQHENYLKAFGLGRSQAQTIYIEDEILNFASVMWIKEGDK